MLPKRKNLANKISLAISLLWLFSVACPSFGNDVHHTNQKEYSATHVVTFVAFELESEEDESVMDSHYSLDVVNVYHIPVAESVAMSYPAKKQKSSFSDHFLCTISSQAP